jgi:hypothetical protein
MKRIRSFLVALDVPGIKRYVFNTNRLVEIRGASALLDSLNRIETTFALYNTSGVTSPKTEMFTYKNPGALTKKYLEDLMETRYGERLDGLIGLLHDKKGLPRGYYKMGYVEMQVYGGVNLSRDVKWIEVLDLKNVAKEVFDFAKMYGLEIREASK